MRTRRRARPVFAALIAALCGGVMTYAVGACTSFDAPPPEPEAASPDPRVEDTGSNVDAPSDGGIADGPLVPYCLTLDAALLCNEFPAPPITLGWGSVANDAGGTAEWTGEAGLTQPGAGVFSTAAFTGPGQAARIYLSRGVPVPSKTPDFVRLELAVRFDQSPDTGGTSIVRFSTGSGIFYIQKSSLGYALTHGYSPPFCASPCAVDVDGPRPPILDGIWDRLSITLQKKTEAGAGTTITFESSSGEKIQVDSPPGFTPAIADDAYLDLGFTQMTPGSKPRTFTVDDLSLTAR